MTLQVPSMAHFGSQQHNDGKSKTDRETFAMSKPSRKLIAGSTELARVQLLKVASCNTPARGSIAAV